jgi:hypothetical protein
MHASMKSRKGKGSKPAASILGKVRQLNNAQQESATNSQLTKGRSSPGQRESKVSKIVDPSQAQVLNLSDFNKQLREDTEKTETAPIQTKAIN